MTTKKELRDALQRCVTARHALEEAFYRVGDDAAKAASLKEMHESHRDASAILARPVVVVGYVWRARAGDRGERWVVGVHGDEASCQRQARNWREDIGAGFVRRLVAR